MIRPRFLIEAGQRDGEGRDPAREACLSEFSIVREHDNQSCLHGDWYMMIHMDAAVPYSGRIDFADVKV